MLSTTCGSVKCLEWLKFILNKILDHVSLITTVSSTFQHMLLYESAAVWYCFTKRRYILKVNATEVNSWNSPFIFHHRIYSIYHTKMHTNKSITYKCCLICIVFLNYYYSMHTVSEKCTQWRQFCPDLQSGWVDGGW